jgi:hypothetical protein
MSNVTKLPFQRAATPEEGLKGAELMTLAVLYAVNRIATWVHTKERPTLGEQLNEAVRAIHEQRKLPPGDGADLDPAIKQMRDHFAASAKALPDGAPISEDWSSSAGRLSIPKSNTSSSI